jgi:hypothetical protein
MNFKGVQTLWKRSGRFTKILSQLDIHKGEFSWVYLYAGNLSFYTSVKWLGLKNKESLNLFEIPSSQHL